MFTPSCISGVADPCRPPPTLPPYIPVPTPPAPPALPTPPAPPPPPPVVEPEKRIERECFVSVAYDPLIIQFSSHRQSVYLSSREFPLAIFPWYTAWFNTNEYKSELSFRGLETPYAEYYSTDYYFFTYFRVRKQGVLLFIYGLDNPFQPQKVFSGLYNYSEDFFQYVTNISVPPVVYKNKLENLYKDMQEGETRVYYGPSFMPELYKHPPYVYFPYFLDEMALDILALNTMHNPNSSRIHRATDSEMFRRYLQIFNSLGLPAIFRRKLFHMRSVIDVYEVSNFGPNLIGTDRYRYLGAGQPQFRRYIWQYPYTSREEYGTITDISDIPSEHDCYKRLITQEEVVRFVFHDITNVAPVAKVKIDRRLDNARVISGPVHIKIIESYKSAPVRIITKRQVGQPIGVPLRIQARLVIFVAQWKNNPVVKVTILTKGVASAPLKVVTRLRPYAPITIIRRGGHVSAKMKIRLIQQVTAPTRIRTGKAYSKQVNLRYYDYYGIRVRD